jgi:hypothetical protein
MRGGWIGVVGLLGVAGCAALAPVVAEVPGAAVLPADARIEMSGDGMRQSYAYCADRLASGELDAGHSVAVPRFCNCVTNTAPLYVPLAEWREINALMAQGGGVDALPPVARKVADACAVLAQPGAAR